MRLKNNLIFLISINESINLFSKIDGNVLIFLTSKKIQYQKTEHKNR
jgi:hypothetical protein